MEGLEAVEVKLSQLERTCRVDAEYFSKPYIETTNRLNMIHTDVLNTTVNISDGNHFSISDYFQEEGMPYYRGKDVTGNFFIEQTQPVCIPQKAFEMPHMVRSHLKRGDVLLSIVGTIGELSLVSSDSEATCSCKLAILRPRSITPGYLAVFLKSKYGQNQIHRIKRGAVQMGLLLEDMDQLDVTRFSSEFEGAIEKTVLDAKGKLEHSTSLASQAEQTLLHDLNLDSWQPPEPLTYIRRASEFFTSKRLDSEYFAPRVSELIARLSTGGILRDVAPARHEPFAPGTTGTFEYIEISNISSDGIAAADTVPCVDAPSRATQYVRKGDVITSTVRPVRRLSAIIRPEQDGYVCSSGFVVLRPVNVAPELLLTYLRLPPVCELMNLHTSASLYPAISERDLLNLPFPTVATEIEAEIVKAVQQAHIARREARELLERAKRAVEIAIEENESSARNFLNMENCNA